MPATEASASRNAVPGECVCVRVEPGSVARTVFRCTRERRTERRDPPPHASRRVVAALTIRMKGGGGGVLKQRRVAPCQVCDGVHVQTRLCVRVLYNDTHSIYIQYMCACGRDIDYAAMHQSICLNVCVQVCVYVCLSGSSYAFLQTRAEDLFSYPDA